MTNQCDTCTIPALVDYGECPEIIRHFVWREFNFSNYGMTYIPVIFHSKNRLKMLTLLYSLIVKYETHTADSPPPDTEQ
jgi:hypothetical protein